MRRFASLFALLMLAAALHAQTIDKATGANWQGKYGSQGYAIPLGISSLQSTATVTVSGSSTWTWAQGFTCWYSSSSFTISVNILDGKSHQVALYIQDYDKQERAESVQAVPTTAFTSGDYVVFNNVSGNTTFTISRVMGPNAVVSGIFFDPGTVVTPPAPTHEVILDWTVSASTGVTGYNVYRNGVKLANTAALTYTDTTVQAGQTYTFTVTTVSAGQESAPVNITAFTIPSP